jgi:hypothetical protein
MVIHGRHGALDDLPLLCLRADPRVDRDRHPRLSPLPLLRVRPSLQRAHRHPFNYLAVSTNGVPLVVRWRRRDKLIRRDWAEMFLGRGFAFTHETMRAWETRSAPSSRGKGGPSVKGKPAAPDLSMKRMGEAAVRGAIWIGTWIATARCSTRC